jgi:hypothetical protein
MAKRTAHTRNTAQRNKPKAQKSIELMRQNSTAKEVEVDSSPEPGNGGVATSATSVPTPTSASKSESTKAATSHNASAAERLAARRQAAQKTQRAAASLITAEHYSYVRNDLIFIAILAIIMFSIIIGLHFVPAIGG